MAKYWFCIIGPTETPPDAADHPMRNAIEAEYRETIGEDAVLCLSGWFDHTELLDAVKRWVTGGLPLNTGEYYYGETVNIHKDGIEFYNIRALISGRWEMVQVPLDQIKAIAQDLEGQTRQIAREEAQRLFEQLARAPLSEIGHRLVLTEKTVEKGVRAIQTLTTEILTLFQSFLSGDTEK